MWPFIGQSMTKGAVIRSLRKPATKVVMDKWALAQALVSVSEL